MARFIAFVALVLALIASCQASVLTSSCQHITSQSTCQTASEANNNACVWCKATAVADICVSSSTLPGLSSAVFTCGAGAQASHAVSLRSGTVKAYLTPAEQLLISLAEKIANERLPTLMKCVHEAEAAYEDFRNFANHLHMNVADVESALKALSAGLKSFKEATTDCGISSVSKKLAVFIAKMDSIIGDVIIATDIIIDGFNIYDDLHAAVVAFEKHDYMTCGRDVGEAIKLILDDLA